MTQADLVYSYLKTNYSLNEPIFLSDISISGLSSVCVRQQLKKLTEKGNLKRFDTGVYFLPKDSIFKSGSLLSLRDVLNQKYLINNGKRCGFISGILFANEIGLTTQVPNVYEIYTNKATTTYRETKMGNLRVILKKPCYPITDQNIDVLQFLELLKEVVDISEVEGIELTEHLVAYMKRKCINFESMRPFLKYYPDRIYKNMYEVGLLNAVFT
ncbi:MAG: hypothetical protein HUK24_02555 [Sphaerochaetaceae bacterium]|nr:hypothetical protein [Sphaerochaetaceae bacterium]